MQAEQGGKEIRSENQPSCMGPIDMVRTSAFTGSKRESSREFGQRKDIIHPFCAAHTLTILNLCIPDTASLNHQTAPPAR